MLVFKLRLPKKQDPEAFATFMNKVYFPSVHKGPTRVGQVGALVLLEGETPETMYDFLLLVGWSGLSSGRPTVDDEEVQRKFESFGATLTPMGPHKRIAAWHARDLM